MFPSPYVPQTREPVNPNNPQIIPSQRQNKSSRVARAGESRGVLANPPMTLANLALAMTLVNFVLV